MTRVLTCALAVALMGLASPARADVSDPGSVTGVSVVSAPGRAEIVIAISGAVQLKDFILKDPARLVVDLTGVTLDGRALGLYDGVNRGGVLNVRTGQYSTQVVRVVVELDAVKDYTIAQNANEIRISFGAERPFLAWSSAAPGEFSAPASRPASARPAGSPEVSAVSYTPVAQGDEPRITVTWDRASIADVVAGFAAFSGRSIILGRDINGTVSAEVKNQPWTQAFYAVLATQGLSATELPGGIIRVDSPSALSALDSLEPLETIVVRMNYARAKEMSKNLDGILTKGRGKVFPDTASNSLIITDTRSRIQSIAAFARGLDIRTPQVAIQAKIIFVNRTSLTELGLKYDLGGKLDVLQQRRAAARRVRRPAGSRYHGGRARRQLARRGRQPRSEHLAAGARPGLVHRHRELRLHRLPERAGADRVWPTSRLSRPSTRWTTAKPPSWSVKRPRFASSTTGPGPSPPSPRSSSSRPASSSSSRRT